MTNHTTTHLTGHPLPDNLNLTPVLTVTTDEALDVVLGSDRPGDVTASNGRGCEACGGWTTNTINGRRFHPRCHDEPTGQQPLELGVELVAQGCAAATRRLRWEYTTAYRRRLRLPGVQPNTHEADVHACVELRHQAPVVLARHLPGIALVEWIDRSPAVIDSSWRIGGWTIDLYWDYHPDWTIGDPTAITIWHEHDSDGEVVS